MAFFWLHVLTGIFECVSSGDDSLELGGVSQALQENSFKEPAPPPPHQSTQETFIQTQITVTYVSYFHREKGRGKKKQLKNNKLQTFSEKSPAPVTYEIPRQKVTLRTNKWSKNITLSVSWDIFSFFTFFKTLMRHSRGKKNTCC